MGTKIKKGTTQMYQTKEYRANKQLRGIHQIPCKIKKVEIGKEDITKFRER